MNNAFAIRIVTQKDLPAIEEFLLYHLETLFTKQGYSARTGEVSKLTEHFITPETSNLWVAYDRHNAVAGIIAACSYDDRIEQVKGRYPKENVGEICRCYVRMSLRRQGIGSKLLQEAETFCVEKGYTTIYLHTHHFLPGGFQFWKKNNYIPFADVGDEYQTVHLEKKLL